MAKAGDPLVLYSTNTQLAYTISERYYKDKHFVWCCPYLGAADLRTGLINPPSSTPLELYRDYEAASARNDRHSLIVAQNRVGLKNGASKKLLAGVINANEHDEIVAIADGATAADFRPILYIVPFHGVKTLAKPASVVTLANVLSLEYIIESLPRRLFDAVQL